MFRRLFAYLDRRPGAANKWGAPFVGDYVPSSTGIKGRVFHWRRASHRPPEQIIATIDADMICTTSDFEEIEPRLWRFSMPVEIAPGDIVRDRLSVFAVDYIGQRYALDMDGKAQLAFIKAAGL